MRWTDLFLQSLINLWRRKLRTMLTMIGVLVGTLSIVLMVSLGLGMQRSMIQQAGQWGSLNLINLNDYSSFDSKSPKLTDKVLKQIGAMEHVRLVAPIFEFYPMRIRYGRYVSYMGLQGVSAEALQMLGYQVDEGRMFNEDTRELELVVSSTYSQNMGNEQNWRAGPPKNFDWTKARLTGEVTDYNANNPGAPAKTKTYRVSIVGVTHAEMSEFAYNAYCDVATLRSIAVKNHKQLLKQSQIRTDSYNRVWVIADDYSNVEALMKVFREEMGLEGWANAEGLAQMEQQMQIIQLVLGSIGGVSMFVAALMIANTMLMAIYERTREIGVMKVLGCRLSNIRFLFLMEAGSLGLVGGLLGLGISLLGSKFLNRIPQVASMGFSSYIPPWLLLVGMAFAVGVAVLAGLYPAHRATRLSALAAIRNET